MNDNRISMLNSESKWEKLRKKIGKQGARFQ